MTKTYRVNGMSCSGCVTSVTNAITGQYPKVAVDVALETGTVRIDGEVDDSRIATLVEDAGFEFGGEA